MELSAALTLTTPAGTVTLNGASDWLWVTNLEGFDENELRVTIDNKSRTDGALVHAIYDGPMHGMVEATLVNSTPAERNTHVKFLRACLRSIKSTSGTFTRVETGQSSESLTVRYDAGLQDKRIEGILHSVQFGLVSETGIWA